MQAVGLDQEDDSDCIDLTKVTAEEVFYSFTDESPKRLIAPKVIERKEETKSMYAEIDSDNESDFDVKYEQTPDNYEDLKTIHKPMFISDLILGF